jgi:hypothetical protein
MPSEVMGPETNPDPLACLLDHGPGSFVTDGKDPLIRLNPVVPDVFLESVSHFLWDEDMLPFLAAFRVSEGQFPVVDVHRPQLQDLADSHAATGHEFQHETVSQFRRRKNDLIDDVFLDNFPGNHGPRPEHLPEHRAVARAAKIRIDVRSYKIEEG